MSLTRLEVPAVAQATAPGTVAPAGPAGASAYALAVQLGFGGTLEEWLASFKGEQGGPGADGASAYQLAQAVGYAGSLAQWLSSLIGASAYQLAVMEGFAGTRAEWLASLKGAPGDDGLVRSVGGASKADLSLADIKALPAEFMTLSAAPSTADIPAGQHRVVYRSDTNTFAWVANVGGALRNVLDRFVTGTDLDN